MNDMPEEAQPAPRQSPEPPGTPPGPGECHIWLVRISLAEAEIAILSTAERARLDRFLVESARNSFIASRTMQRKVVAYYSGTDPGRVVIERTCEHCGDAAHGRPRATGTTIDYSVSHSADMLVLAVVGSGRVGIDVEYVQQRHADLDGLDGLDGLAKKIMTPQEWSRYLEVDPAARIGFFYRLWTRKEAVVKLTGHGLAQPLSGIEVTDARIPAGTIAGWRTECDIHLLDLTGPRGIWPSLSGSGPADHPAHSAPAPHGLQGTHHARSAQDPQHALDAQQSQNSLATHNGRPAQESLPAQHVPAVPAVSADDYPMSLASSAPVSVVRFCGLPAGPPA
jgi:4'-phosphopantetheinyl transferase